MEPAWETKRSKQIAIEPLGRNKKRQSKLRGEFSATFAFLIKQSIGIGIIGTIFPINDS